MDVGEVAVESLVMVAGLPQGAELAQLPGAHLAATAGIQDVAGAGGAPRGLGGTPAWVRAGLWLYLQGKQGMERMSLPQGSRAGE